MKIIAGGAATTAPITPLAGSKRTWTATITAHAGTTIATVLFIAPDNSVKSR